MSRKLDTHGRSLEGHAHDRRRPTVKGRKGIKRFIGETISSSSEQGAWLVAGGVGVGIRVADEQGGAGASESDAVSSVDDKFWSVDISGSLHGSLVLSAIHLRQSAGRYDTAVCIGSSAASSGLCF